MVIGMKKTDNVRVTSIARKINFQKISQQFIEFVAIDILVCVFAVAIFIYNKYLTFLI